MILAKISANLYYGFSLSNIFSEVKTQAGCWSAEYRFMEWWGFSMHLPRCLIDNFIGVKAIGGVISVAINWRNIGQIASTIARFGTASIVIVSWLAIQGILIGVAKSKCGYANIYITWSIVASWSRCS
jgi:hypothetical protein